MKISAAAVTRQRSLFGSANDIQNISLVPDTQSNSDEILQLVNTIADYTPNRSVSYINYSCSFTFYS